MKLLVFYFIYALFLFGCQLSIKDRIIEEIERNCKNFDRVDGCIISLENLTDFEWERMYVFGGPAYTENISRAIGFDCNCSFLPDDCMRLLFVNHGKVVYLDDYEVDSYKQIQFRELDWMNDKAPIYTPSTAKFFVLRRPNELNPRTGGYLYDLFPIEGTLKPAY
ncbi:MAG: hypothetical protein L0287_21300 [Anaerolineae bacterium]|nr:hypothetical protein [Anaerolineae bacterium]